MKCVELPIALFRMIVLGLTTRELEQLRDALERAAREAPAAVARRRAIVRGALRSRGRQRRATP